MKKIVIAFFLTLLAFSSLRAAIFQLNNNYVSPGQYTTFAAAQTAAASGDTIMVHGSPVNYGVITISKVLTIIGPGHKPNKFPSVTAEFSNININSNLAGIKIYGIKFNVLYDLNFAFLKNVDDLTIENIFCTGYITIGADCQNIIIRGSVFDNANVNLQGSNADNILLEHNYFSRSNPLLDWSGVGQKLVQHNIFAWSGSGTLTDAMRSTLLVNNIFYGLTANAGTQTDCVYNNNLSFGHNTNNTLPPTGQGGSNNLVNVNPQFENVQAPTAASAFNYTRNYRLQSGSPAVGAGSGGKNIGLYTPGFDFSMTGEPLRPQTILLKLDPITIPAGGTSTVNFTGRKATVNAQ